ncbi:MAG: deoxyribonuclease V [candidate division KSB1 bacterium]|nr:deoxyribonuclease V [candidate division KSB1 bacterium]MDQ7066469.1 deoxyribonuclease V [candidate division KSB1 bacterium]
MIIHPLHAWDLTPQEAIRLQQELRQQVIIRPLRHSVRLIAGADVAYRRESRTAFAGVVVMKLDDLQVVETVTVEAEVHFPYIPGLLTCREGPALLAAFEKLHTVPDAVIFDGQGIAHPRGMGIASHMGLWLRLPTAGCAKNRLVGEYEPVGKVKGASSPLRYHGEVIGAVVRTRSGVKPVFVSPGHWISVEDSVRLVLQATDRFRLPEPVRQAHLLVNEARRKQEKKVTEPQ